ncbi:MAG: nickel-dependent lactate racemase [Proteobacteria bacterium]|nr:nickel-dependent lactate racemase [Pseudomonadota bacterium]
MEIDILCGHETVRLVLPRGAEILEAHPMPVLNDPEASVAASLRDPIDSPPLAQLARGRKTVCVVISDITRPVPNRVILPPLLRTLESAGIERAEMTILIATGTHRPNLGQELVDLVGEPIATGYKIINHDCRRRDTHRRIGELGGAPVEINTAYLDADLKILTGLIEPHPYAGYSGGAKSILPGLSSLETMKFMHSFKMIAHPNVTNCILDGNPFYQATRDVAALSGVDFIVNAVINKEKQPAGIFSGSLHGAHLAGCRMVGEFSVIHIKKPADLVITSGGGTPMDATFYQCGKGLLVAKGICRPGGAVIMACGCAQGIGSDTYAELVAGHRDLDEFSRMYADPRNFVMDQWAAQSYFQSLNRIGRVLVYSPGLTAEQLNPFGVQKIHDLQKEVDKLLLEYPQVAAIPQGPYVVGLTN